MKKLLQTISLVSVVSTGAHAGVKDLMYVRADATFTKFHSVSVGSNNLGLCNQNVHTLIANGRRYDNKYNLGSVVGVGYNVSDKLRAELVYNKVFADGFKYINNSSDSSVLSANVSTFYGKTYSSKIRANIDALLGRVAYEVLDLGRSQIFVGAGAGVARVRHKTIGSIVLVIPGCQQNGQLKSYNISSKNKNTFAYSLMLGATTKITPDLHVEVSYQFSDYGTTGKFTGQNNGRIPLRSHNIAVGLRYDVM